jgi:hypothetical protein
MNVAFWLFMSLAALKLLDLCCCKGAFDPLTLALDKASIVSYPISNNPNNQTLA